jgi:Lipoprotein confined to pathogenic Mycobacterium
MNAQLRIISAVVAGTLTVFGISGCSEYEKLRKGVDELSHPDSGPPSLTNDQKIKFIDSLRTKGSFETARERLTNTAQSIAEQISAAVPGQSWKFADDENERDAYENGSLCDQLDPDISRRPRAKTVEFATPLSADSFTTATDIVRQAAAKYGASNQTSLFNDSAKREYDVQGSGYEFNLGQIKLATLLIKGDCFLLQKVVDMPPGQLPS